MKILLSNDDGYDAPGLLALYAAVLEIADVIVVAPEINQSGCSSKLSLRQDVKVRTHKNGFMSVDGTPADCVHLAITGMLDFQPDIVISGINNGPNLGDDVIYSGTVAAAIEGRFLPLPGMAVSLAGSRLNNYAAAACVVVDLLKIIDSERLPQGALLNINIPDLPYEQIGTFLTTRLGKRHQSQPIVRDASIEEFAIYRIGAPGAVEIGNEGTDFHAIQKNKVSITPITIDMTDYNKLSMVSNWIEECAK